MSIKIHSTPDVSITEELLKYIRKFLVIHNNKPREGRSFVIIYFVGRRELSKELNIVMGRIAQKISADDYMAIWEALYKLCGRDLPPKFLLVDIEQDKQKYDISFVVDSHMINIDIEHFPKENLSKPIELDYVNGEIVSR